MSVKAVGLVSGGLDSLLAVALVLRQGIEVHAINFRTGFSGRIGSDESEDGNLPEVFKGEFFKQFRGKLFFEQVHVEDGYLNVLSNPKYGFGKNVNPCIDCRIYSFNNAKAYMEKIGADFIFTGEVIAQRPMTQHRNTMSQIVNQSDMKGLVLRPLCAQLLPPTAAEERGLIDRTLLMNFSGRGRKRQMALAKELGLENYPQPAGGCCYLTDPGYARRFRDLVRYRDQGKLATRDFQLLKLGRHLRMADDFKVIVGRNEEENRLLEELFGDHPSLELIDVPGPLVLIDGKLTEERIELAARIAARYSKCREGKVQVEYHENSAVDTSVAQVLEVEPLTSAETDQFVIK